MVFDFVISHLFLVEFDVDFFIFSSDVTVTGVVPVWLRSRNDFDKFELSVKFGSSILTNLSAKRNEWNLFRFVIDSFEFIILLLLLVVFDSFILFPTGKSIQTNLFWLSRFKPVFVVILLLLLFMFVSDIGECSSLDKFVDDDSSK